MTKYIFENTPKLIIQFNSPISQLHEYLTKEYLRAGRNPLEATSCLQDLFNGETQRLTREFGVKVTDKEYLHRLCLCNLNPKIKQGFIELYCKEVLKALKNKKYGEIEYVR